MSYDRNKAWRAKHPESRARSRARNYAQTQGGPNTGKWWTQAEDDRVLAHDTTDRELAAELGRSVQGIQVRRSRLVAA